MYQAGILWHREAWRNPRGRGVGEQEPGIENATEEGKIYLHNPKRFTRFLSLSSQVPLTRSKGTQLIQTP
jgi:hypothetical protein